MSSIGKYRHLSRCSTAKGHFVVLAIDHRANLLSALRAARQGPVDDAAFTAFKLAIMQAAAPYVSAVLVDPDFGLAASIAQRLLPGHVGLLSPMEVTDYDIHPSKRVVTPIAGWSIGKVKKSGCDGVKLLLPYHPQAADAAQKQAIVTEGVERCAAYDIPFFLEPIPYALEEGQTLGDPELLEWTIDLAELFSSLRVDILKLAFPVLSNDTSIWEPACRALNTVCQAPWTLLSGGTDFETFAKQAEVACQAGASGVIVGRAVWAEAIQLWATDTAAFNTFCQQIIPARLQMLAQGCEANATPWFNRIQAPSHPPRWYFEY
jgi:tagatose 1,6-diphosphate aldolase